jgi:hypothetical protein
MREDSPTRRGATWRFFRAHVQVHERARSLLIASARHLGLDVIDRISSRHQSNRYFGQVAAFRPTHPMAPADCANLQQMNSLPDRRCRKSTLSRPEGAARKERKGGFPRCANVSDSGRRHARSPVVPMRTGAA